MMKSAENSFKNTSQSANSPDDPALIERVMVMEARSNRLQKSMDQLAAALDAFEQNLSDLKILLDYYTDGQWMQDFDADQNGHIPETICRGILSEDLLYDQFSDADSLLDTMQKLIPRLEEILHPDPDGIQS